MQLAVVASQHGSVQASLRDLQEASGAGGGLLETFGDHLGAAVVKDAAASNGACGDSGLGPG